MMKQPSPEDLLSGTLFWTHVQSRLLLEETPCPGAETPAGAVSRAQPDLQPAGATERIEVVDCVEVEVTHFDPERVQAAFEASPDEDFDHLLDELVSAESKHTPF